MRVKSLLLTALLIVWPLLSYGYNVSGTVTNGTTKAPLAHYPVVLKQYQGQNEQDVATDTTGAEGHFAFRGLQEGEQYGLSVVYQIVKYEDLRWDKPLPEKHPLQLTVYDTTRSDTSIRISMQHTVMTEGEGRLFVRQIMRIENPGDKAFIGTVPVSKNAYRTLSFHLPHGATNVQAGDGFMSCCVGRDQNGFYDTMEVLPGSKDVVLYYELPVNSEHFKFRDITPYPVQSYVALIKRQRASVTSDTLSVLDTAADKQFVQLAANNIQRGAVIPIRFENFLQPPRDYGAYFVGLFVVVLIGGIFLAYKSNRGNQTQTREGPMPRDPVCQMPVPKEDRAYTTVYQGETYYFCCEGCQEAFEKAPEEYVAMGDADR